MAEKITFDEFKKLELRVAEILEAVPHPNADRLYVVTIKIGAEERQVVAGIRAHYTTEELKGKKVVFVANLEPATIRGVESQGMLLAASNDTMLTLVTPERAIDTGAPVR